MDACRGKGVWEGLAPGHGGLGCHPQKISDNIDANLCNLVHFLQPIQQSYKGWDGEEVKEGTREKVRWNDEVPVIPPPSLQNPVSIIAWLHFQKCWPRSLPLPGYEDGAYPSISVSQIVREVTLQMQCRTRKPSWRKGKRATAVRVWRPLAKKSTANLQLMVNSNRGRITYGLRIAGYFRV